MGTSRISGTAACLGCSCANVLCRVSLLLSAHHMKYKVGYKRVDVYGTLLGSTPHRN